MPIYMRDDIPVSTLRVLLSYNPVTGVLTWLPREQDLFKPGPRQKWACDLWNSRFAYQIAGHLNKDGYLEIGIFGKAYAAHRVAWALHYGVWPTGEIDHENGIGSANQISNIRDAAHRANMQNQKMRVDNTTGQMGVYRHAASGRWNVRVGHRSFGYYDDLDDAIAARKQAEKEMGYHPNHGRPA